MKNKFLPVVAGLIVVQTLVLGCSSVPKTVIVEREPKTVEKEPNVDYAKKTLMRNTMLGHAAEMTKRLPIMVNDETEIFASFFLNDTMYGMIRMLNMSANDPEVMMVAPHLKSIIEMYFCSDPKIKFYTENGVFFTLYFLDSVYKYIGTAEIKPDDCKKFYS